MFDKIVVGRRYSRPQLASQWGYKGYQALARGVVTPSRSRNIIIFVTEEKQQSSEQYDDRLSGDLLQWEGPKDHFGESRMLNATQTGDHIHVFYRAKHHFRFRI
jgi:hypothetical protein